jgi:hypothetical protein
MSFEHLRRSSRIPKELAILLTGSDLDGKGFSEMTKTVLLSRYGAGIISTYKLYAEQEIIVRYLDTNKEAVVRVVGRIGSEGDIYTYGVAFVDPSTMHFWGLDFAPVAEKDKEARCVLLECGNCKERETVEHSDVETDVLIINEGIVRHCKHCGDSTLWKRASEVPDERPVLVAAGSVPSVRSSKEATNMATREAPRAPQGSESVSTPANLESSPTAPTPSAYGMPAERKSSAPIDNRRKHPRARVNYKACIRRSGFPDEVVACEDMSKGGICFKSRKKHFERTAIEIAVPYAPGGNAIFVPAEITWVVEFPKDKLYKCGVAYRLTSRPS